MRKLIVVAAMAVLLAGCAASDPLEPDPAATPARWEGSGSGEITLFPGLDRDPLWTAEINYSGTGNFMVSLRDIQGNQLDPGLPVNAEGPYSGTVPLFDPNARALSITASGPWTVEARQLADVPRWEDSDSYSGSGDTVLIVEDVIDGDVPAWLTHDGSSSFTVTAWPAGPPVPEDDWSGFLFVNVVGAVDSGVLIPGETRVLTITAGGAWTIELLEEDPGVPVTLDVN